MWTVWICAAAVAVFSAGVGLGWRRHRLCLERRQPQKYLILAFLNAPPCLRKGLVLEETESTFLVRYPDWFLSRYDGYTTTRILKSSERILEVFEA